MNKYKFRKYNPHFKKLYQKEKLKLNKILSKDIKIEHIGSTAVQGLGGKGIIDIIIAVSKKQVNKIKNKLIKNKYNFKPKGGDKNRLFFEKDYGILLKRRVHVHLTTINSKDWKDCIKVRNKLRKNKKLQEEYSKIKREGVKICKGEGKIYREYKSKFLERISK
jgi:GrpB-like predicted nucleotidyltransferase (UPF0157 family)